MENQEVQLENQEVQLENQDPEIQVENQDPETEAENQDPEIPLENQERTQILLAITQSSEKGYPHPSKRSKAAFEQILEKIVRSNIGRFSLQLLHVQDRNATHEEFEKGLDLLEDFDFQCLKIGVPSKTRIGTGVDTKVVICDEVERINADLLVMGSGKLGSFRRFFNRGESVSEYCLKNAECPVITINEKVVKGHTVLRKLR